MDKTQELWDQFIESGRISDYLAYRDALRMEMAMEDSDAFQHRRRGDSGEGDEGK